MRNENAKSNLSGGGSLRFRRASKGGALRCQAVTASEGDANDYKTDLSVNQTESIKGETRTKAKGKGGCQDAWLGEGGEIDGKDCRGLKM